MTKYGTAALAIAGVLAMSTTSASAQWGGRYWGAGIGFAAGALVGAAIAARPYYGGGYYAAPGYGYYG